MNNAFCKGTYLLGLSVIMQLPLVFHARDSQTGAVKDPRIVFTILSQGNTFNARAADMLLESIRQQARASNRVMRCSLSSKAQLRSTENFRRSPSCTWLTGSGPTCWAPGRYFPSSNGEVPAWSGFEIVDFSATGSLLSRCLEDILGCYSERALIYLCFVLAWRALVARGCWYFFFIDLDVIWNLSNLAR